MEADGFWKFLCCEKGRFHDWKEHSQDLVVVTKHEGSRAVECIYTGSRLKTEPGAASVAGNTD